MEPLQNIKLSFKCPKQLNELQPCNGDWYCDGCHKIVYDFRGMNETQVMDAFAKNNYQMCGIFDAGRIEVLPQLPKWFKWVSAAMLFLGLASWQGHLKGEVMRKPVDTLKNEKVDPFPLGKVIKRPINTKKSDNYSLLGMAIEIVPSFPGGEVALAKYLKIHLTNTNKLVGKVYVKFIVERDGSLSDITIVKSSVPEANAEAIAVFRASPKWKPGLQNGKPIRVQFTVPVNFSLRG
jgi:TonB family protein